jgi:hypothetical protein
MAKKKQDPFYVEFELIVDGMHKKRLMEQLNGKKNAEHNRAKKM